MIDFGEKKYMKKSKYEQLRYKFTMHMFTHRTTHKMYLTISSYVGKSLKIMMHFTFLDHNEYFLISFLFFSIFVFFKYLLLKYDKKHEHKCICTFIH